ncbi:hypothetical protein [Actinoplanes xinjiangensis]|uniref:hypothetical protein n=1 Tax=Actinoplanes xinjiangensis TaxID=512350 RepID=UPI00342B86D3
MPENPVDRDISSMVRDARIAEAVRNSLQRLSEGHAGPDMAQMARDVLEGRIRLGDIARDPAYADGFLRGLDRYRRWEAGLDDEERRRFNEEVRKAGEQRPDPPA